MASRYSQTGGRGGCGKVLIFNASSHIVAAKAMAASGSRFKVTSKPQVNLGDDSMVPWVGQSDEIRDSLILEDWERYNSLAQQLAQKKGLKSAHEYCVKLCGGAINSGDIASEVKRRFATRQADILEAVKGKNDQEVRIATDFIDLIRFAFFLVFELKMDSPLDHLHEAMKCKLQPSTRLPSPPFGPQETNGVLLSVGGGEAVST